MNAIAWPVYRDAPIRQRKSWPQPKWFCGGLGHHAECLCDVDLTKAVKEPLYKGRYVYASTAELAIEARGQEPTALGIMRQMLAFTDAMAPLKDKAAIACHLVDTLPMKDAFADEYARQHPGMKLHGDTARRRAIRNVVEELPTVASHLLCAPLDDIIAEGWVLTLEDVQDLRNLASVHGTAQGFLKAALKRPYKPYTLRMTYYALHTALIGCGDVRTAKRRSTIANGAENAAKARELVAAGWSQRQVAVALRADQSTVSRWIKGTRQAVAA